MVLLVLQVLVSAEEWALFVKWDLSTTQHSLILMHILWFLKELQSFSSLELSGKIVFFWLDMQYLFTGSFWLSGSFNEIYTSISR